MKHRNLIALGLASLTLAASVFATSAVAGPPKKKPAKPAKKAPPKAPSAIEEGKKIYEKFSCSACHAIAGKGGAGGPELTKIGADAKHDDKFLTEAIVNPKADSPDSTMPSYEETIKGKDLKNLVAYLRSLK